MSDIHLPTTAASSAGIPMTIPEVLRASAEVVLKKGYANSTRHADDFAVHHGNAQRLGSVCAIGAVEGALSVANNCAEGSPLAVDSLNALAKHIQPGEAAHASEYRSILGSILTVANWSNSLIRWLGSKEAAGAALARTFEAAADNLEASSKLPEAPHA